ncbi:flagellar hook-associated protein FlgL [Erwinia sorbitola]|uniref:Flagellar hook-associated protein 3 n=1 Tax=Erwinia sorbitola TaxID=2681984 RepID=A0A6I6EVA3_9GAMM|nr:flagellar hook-associated protein FlgL [Erwinia sorbitola]MTD26949.1 flagellar hook-associated protein 3 [Erwinia sorbitola]QGU88512.1 flagellar hook-associated protein 3 [Erwinia sorbitola]
MRISNQSFNNNTLLNFNRNNAQLFNVQNKISQQTRLLKPSDDPIASAQLTRLRREKSAIDQYQTNIQRLSGNLATQENSIKGCEQQLLAIKDKLLEAMGGTLSADEISGYGKQLASMLETTVTLINARDEDGRYLFSGTKTDQQPVVFDAASQSWSYQGNSDTASALVAGGTEVQVTTALIPAFGDDLKMLSQLQEVANKMQDSGLAPADYYAEIQAAFNSVGSAHNSVSTLYTELGARQNSLTLLKDIHDDNNVVNDTVTRSITALDMAEASIDLANFYNAALASQKSFTKIQQLSLFSLI